MKVLLLCFSLVGLLMQLSWAQSGVNLNTAQAKAGYALITLDHRAVLIDNCGEIVHEWATIEPADNHYKLLPNGNLVFIGRGRVYEYTWGGDLVHNYGINGVTLTYEVEVLPNGNYLCVGRRSYGLLEFEDMGFDISVHFPTQLDVVVEIERSTGNLIWEWNIGDHMIQERDASVGNYGIVADHPELLNIDAISTFDWTFRESFMINSLDYNPKLDQIVLSIRKMSEFIIIDHSTPANLVSGSTGGNQGKGGDILYRFGNPQNYGQGTEADRQLYFQHNPNWIDEGPQAGMISVYNNGLSRPAQNPQDRYSSADITDTRVNSDGSYTLPASGRYEPYVADIRYNKNTNLDFNFYSGYLSGATVLDNGNIWITVGTCDVYELNPAGEPVWVYKYDTNIFCFRSVKYAPDYPAFEDRDLTPKGTIESTTNPYDCNLISAANDINNFTDFKFTYTPYSRTISMDNVESPLIGQIINTQGQLIQEFKIKEGNQDISLKSLSTGIYFCRFLSMDSRHQKTYKFILI